MEEKLDKILADLSDIKTALAVSQVKSDHVQARVGVVEKATEQYKNDRAKIIGGSTVLSGIFAYIIHLFKS